MGQLIGAEDRGPHGEHHSDAGPFDAIIEEKLDVGRYATVGNGGEVSPETGYDLLVRVDETSDQVIGGDNVVVEAA